MQRKIAFRAWDKTSKQMFGGIISMFFNSDFTSQYPSLEFMQYTGLKDKNGKEIYEGDIVLNHFSPGRYEKLILTQDFFYIVYRMQSLNVEFKNDLNHTFEIIGNIYENPELLK